ncbi:hypothetical protein [Kitasatospora sp. NPDC001175]|uniref:hypothetical protein n=1 Tax=Kitasatospora sp. NPDC001175 TaxID=3157103 RepID=UPI003CFFBACA
MGIKLVVEVLDYAPATLTHREKLLLVVLAEDARDGNRRTWNSIEDPKILRRAKVSRSQLYEVVKGLIAKDVLKKEQSGQKNGTAKYVILPLAPQCPENRDTDASQRPENPDTDTASQRPENPDTDTDSQRPENPDTDESQCPENRDVSVPESGTPTPHSPQFSLPSKTAAPAEPPAPTQSERETINPAAWPILDAYVAGLGRPVSPATRTKLHQQATEYLAAGFPAWWLQDRARELAAKGWTDLAQHCDRSTVPTTRQTTASKTDWCGHCDDPNHRMHKDPARDNELVPCQDCHPAAVARRRRLEAGAAA